MKDIDYDQKVFIVKEYKFLSNLCNKHLHNKDFDMLNVERARIGVFINTIEKLFNIDFYTWYNETI